MLIIHNAGPNSLGAIGFSYNHCCIFALFIWSEKGQCGPGSHVSDVNIN